MECGWPRTWGAWSPHLPWAVSFWCPLLLMCGDGTPLYPSAMTTSPSSPLSPAEPRLGPLITASTFLKPSKLQYPYLTSQDGVTNSQSSRLSLDQTAWVDHPACVGPFPTSVTQAMSSENLGQAFRGVTSALSPQPPSAMGQRPGSSVPLWIPVPSPTLQKPGQACGCLPWSESQAEGGNG